MRNKVKAIKAIIDEWDPYDLLTFCPPDEYHFEIEEIVKVLSYRKNAQDLAKEIKAILTFSFGDEYPKWEYAQCFIIAEKILKLL